MSDPLATDFHQLRVLRLVYRLNSFSGAAGEMGVNQSSISYTIDRLRKAFGDPLFVRQGASIAPTQRCREIVAGADKLLTEFEAIVRPTSLDPGTSKGTLTISCNAYERLLLMPALVRRLRTEAPGFRLNIITAVTHGNRHLLDGEADLLLSPLDIRESGIYGEPLVSEHYICIMDPSNPLGQTPLDVDTYLAAPHLSVSYGGGWRSPYVRAIAAAGHELNQVVTTPSLADLPRLLEGTDLIATVPSRLPRHFPDRLKVVPCPFPAPFDIHMLWTARSSASQLVLWLRGLIREVAAEL